MLIGCTKKLQDEMGITINASVHEDNDLFSWSAHMITVNRRKTVVVVNDSSRFGFVLYGLKAKDFKKMEELISQGIRIYLQSEKIKEDIIEQYLKEAGSICFSKTKGPKYVSRLNKACEIISFYEEVLDSSSIYQREVSKKINGDLIKIDKKYDYEHPYELLIKDFKGAYGDSIIKCEAVDLLIKLNLGNYKVQRRIITPKDINFDDLHKIIQNAFEWENQHLHDYNIFNEEGKCILNVISNPEVIIELREDCPTVLESEVLVKDYIQDGFKILYCYDFGDNWQHEIIVKGIIPDYDKNYPICLEGIGDAPPEDVGGIPGFEEFIVVIKNPNHPKYQKIKLWADSQWYREFDIELINRRLKHALRE